MSKLEPISQTLYESQEEYFPQLEAIQPLIVILISKLVSREKLAASRQKIYLPTSCPNL